MNENKLGMRRVARSAVALHRNGMRSGSGSVWHRLARKGAVLVALAGWLPTPPAAAQTLTSDQQKCANLLSKDLWKGASARGNQILDCIKSGAKGDFLKLGPEGTVEGCLPTDRRGKLAKAFDKTAQDFERHCTGVDRNGVSKRPAYGVTQTDIINGLAHDGESLLIHDLFGSNLDTALVPEAIDKDRSKCQQAIAKSLKKCQDTRFKEFNHCEKQGFKSKHGLDPLIMDAQSLASCIGSDPKGKIAKACDLGQFGDKKVDKLRKDIEKKCLAKGVALDVAFPGCAVADPDALHTCLSRAIECRTCIMLDQADDLRAECPACIPQGEIHGVCHLDVEQTCTDGDRKGLACEDILAHSDCPPGPNGNPSSRCLAPSHFLVNTVDKQPLLSLVAGFDLAIDCGQADPVTGVANCVCAMENITPIDIPIIGVTCISGFSGCAGGVIDCDGGEVLNTEVRADHAIGNCGVNDDPNEVDPNSLMGPRECDDECDLYCAQLGPEWNRFNADCEGYCNGGVNDGRFCEQDTNCPGGACPGSEPVVHANVCGCTCLRHTGRSALPGSFSCETGVSVGVEMAAPCMVDDGINDVSFVFGTQCVPMTTDQASATILNAGNVLGQQISSPSRSGQPLSCMDLQNGDLSDMIMSGNMAFLDTGLGDLVIPIRYDCR